MLYFQVWSLSYKYLNLCLIDKFFVGNFDINWMVKLSKLYRKTLFGFVCCFFMIALLTI